MSLHINAPEGAIANKILLPGDPLRAKYIAEKYLEKPACYNAVRGMLGFTGIYKGQRVSVQGTGMGMPSIGIYANELMASYGVKTLIRIGTCGAIQPDLALRDIVMASAATTDSNMNHDRFGSISFAPCANFYLLNPAYEAAKARSLEAKIGNIFTSDKFYDDRLEEKIALLRSYGILAVDMETAELYTLAARYGAAALTIMTVSDSLVTHEKTTAEERQTSFDTMIRLALDVI